MVSVSLIRREKCSHLLLVVLMIVQWDQRRPLLGLSHMSIFCLVFRRTVYTTSVFCLTLSIEVGLSSAYDR